MAKQQVSGMEQRQKRRGRPPKQPNNDLTNGDANSTNRKQSNRVKREIYKVFSIKITDGFEACAVRHNNETLSILVRTDNGDWKSLVDKDSVFYRMIDRAVRSKKHGAILVGMYYDPNMALIPAGAKGTYRELVVSDTLPELIHSGG